jgi:hypothetical protein
MQSTKKALLVGEFLGLTAIFIVMSPIVALAVVSAGWHSSGEDIERRREWHAQQFKK